MDSSLNSKLEIQSATPPMEDNNSMEDSSHNDEAAISSALEIAGNGDSSQPPTISSKLLRMLEAETNRQPVLKKMQNNEEVFDVNDGVVSEAPRTKRVSATEAE